ncbi:MAG: helix-turn-helix transcriptional regulator [Planctomycetota bacterium]|jgi:transcriptional regulator with XRE-family HTH domain|nr:helix-turn-helix transcriptional regulator [Planctomycetota bacterium]
MTGETPQPDFGDYLHRLVRRRGLTMAEFAEQIGATPSTLSRIRTGKRQAKSSDIETWATALQLEDDERATLHEFALLAQAPEALRARLARAEHEIAAERDRRSTLEHHYAEYRREQNFYDGYWLAYHRSFLNDDTITRSLGHVTGDSIAWLNMEAGRVHYSYTGTTRVLGDKIFMMMEEDRGGAEFVQVTCNALFDFRSPSFLYGIVTGLSGKTIRHPVSYPAAARMVLVYAGPDTGVTNEQLEQIQSSLGSFDERSLGPLLPSSANEDLLRRCLQLHGRDDLDAVLLRMIDNRLSSGEHALTAAFR